MTMRIITTFILVIIVPVTLMAYWEENGNLVSGCDRTYKHDNQRICPDGMGNFIVVWSGRSDQNEGTYAQKIDSNGNILWSEGGIALATGYGDPTYPDVMATSSGGCIITWCDSKIGFWDIFAQRLNSNGEKLWGTEGVVVYEGPGVQNKPKIASDGLGGAIIVWWCNNNGIGGIWSQRIDSNGLIKWENDRVKVALVRCYGGFDIASDRHGGVIVEFVGGNYMYGARVDSLGNRLWGDYGVLVSNDKNFYPEVVTDIYGDAIFASYDERQAVIEVKKVNLDGSFPWPASVCAYDGAKNDYSLAPDMAGGVIVSFQAGSRLVYSRRVDSSGNIKWLSTICDNSNEKGGVQLIESNGSFISAWHEKRNDCAYCENDYDIFAQKVDVFGTTEWETNGIEVCQYAIKEQLNPMICSDGFGGAIVTWKDKRNVAEIYANRVYSNGSVPTDIGNSGNPTSVQLYQNYPNPFNPHTTICYELTKSSHVSLEIYNANGQLIKKLVNKYQHAGRKRAIWYGSNENEEAVASGVYFYRIIAGDFIKTKKMILIR